MEWHNEIEKDNDDNHHSPTTTKPTKSKPSTYITTVENTSVKYYNQIFNQVMWSFLENQNKNQSFTRHILHHLSLFNNLKQIT